MNLRLSLFQLAAKHQLDDSDSAQLQRLAGLRAEPAGLARGLPRGLAVLAAALLGLGLVFWIAANWESLGRFGRFALLQGVFLVMCLGALARPAARAPLGLLALLATGGLFAYFGQTYQTGADPWQLFALWALLALPLCCAIRSDVLWLPWSLVALTAIALWVHAHTGHRWRVEAAAARIQAIGWSLAWLLAYGFSPAWRHLGGAGAWPLRSTVLLTACMMSLAALLDLFDQHRLSHYWLALAMLAAAGGAMLWPRLRLYDVFALSAIGLALDTLLVCGLSKLLPYQDGHALFWLLLGLAAAALLAATVKLLLWSARRAQAVRVPA